MPEYKEAYLKKHFDNFFFFDPECRDRRVREINMRTKRCLVCPGLGDCRTHPDFWLQGLSDRLAANEKLPAAAE
jgi:hypothetical protein